MDQKFTLSPDGEFFGGTSSGWIDVWDKPYNAVLTVHRSVDGRFYYFSTGWKAAYIFDVASKKLRRDCLDTFPLKPTELAHKLIELRAKGHEALEEADPGASRLWSYVARDDLGEIPADPPPSRYYANVVYLGKFGVIPNARQLGRGEGVGFSPAGKTPEPRFGFTAACG